MRPSLPPLLFVCLLAPPTAGAQTWVPIGPSGGTVVALAAGAGTLIALAPQAGPFVSDDGGALWRSTAAGPAPSELFAQAWIGADRTLYVSDGNAELWRSRDQGASWTSLRAAGVAAGASPRLLDLDVAADRPQEVVGVFDTRPFRSHDGGDSWEPLTGFPEDTAVFDLRFDPRSSRRLLAASSHGILWSNDGGSSWHDSNVNDPVLDLAFEAGYRGRIYVLASNGDPRVPRSTVLVSLDHGRSFSRRAVLGFATHLAVDPTTSGGLYVTSLLGEVWRSTSSGRSFSLRGRLPRAPVRAIAADAAGAVYVAIPGGPFGRSILRSLDQGARWTPRVAGFRAADVLALAPAPDGTRWWAGLGPVGGTSQPGSQTGIWVLDERGWRAAGLRDRAVDAVDPHPLDADEVVAATLGGGIARTVDGGRSWLAVSPSGDLVTSLARDPTDPRHLVATATAGTAVSHDAGAHWQALPGVDTGARLRFARHGGAFYASLAADGWVARSTVDALVRYADDGRSKINLLTVTGLIRGILETDAPEGALWVATTDFDGTLFTGAVERSLDGGLNWQQATLPGKAPALALAAEPGAHGRVLVGSAGVVYATADGGSSWTALAAGLPRGVWVTTLVFGADGRWRAGTRGAGVFVLSEEAAPAAEGEPRDAAATPSAPSCAPGAWPSRAPARS